MKLNFLKKKQGVDSYGGRGCFTRRQVLEKFDLVSTRGHQNLLPRCFGLRKNFLEWQQRQKREKSLETCNVTIQLNFLEKTQRFTSYIWVNGLGMFILDPNSLLPM